MEPSANIQAKANSLLNSERSSNPASKIIEPVLSSESTNTKKDIPAELASPVIKKEPKTLSKEASASSEAKMSKLREFSELAEKASLFEFAMAAVGAVFTGFQADWLSYMHESFGEFAENHLMSANEGEKEINPLVGGLLKLVSFAFGVKTKDGKGLESTTDFVKVQDKLIGALNMFTSSISGLVIAFKAVPAAITGKQALDFTGKIPALNFVSTKILPTVNAGLMWMSGSVKRRLAIDMQKESYGEHNKAEIDGAFTSGAEDYICGSNSLALMVRQAVGAASPRLANILEPVLATWIAGSAFKTGYESFIGGEEDEPKYELNKLDKSSFGTGFYNLAKVISKPMGVKLPELNSLAA